MKVKFFLFFAVFFVLALVLIKGQNDDESIRDHSVKVQHCVVASGKALPKDKGNLSEKGTVPTTEKTGIKPEFVLSRGKRACLDFDRGLTPLEHPTMKTKAHAYAERHGAIGKVTIRVVDSDGEPVEFADVKGGGYIGDEKGVPFSTSTDTNGLAVIEGKCIGDMNVHIDKSGYYRSRFIYWFPQRGYDCVKDGRWLPWNPIIEVILKRIVNPVAMYVAEAFDNSHHDIPHKNKPLQFDLKENDWVAPVGTGKVADLEIVFEWDGAMYADYNGSSLTLRFNEPYSGVYKIPSDTFSRFMSPYHANTNAVFNKEITFRYIHGRKASETFDMQMQEDACLILRVRPRVDKDGNLVGAHYAKIYGPFHFGYGIQMPGSMSMLHYFNPNENDTNLEADTIKNLLPPHNRGFKP